MGDEQGDPTGRRGEPSVQARPTGPEARLIAFYERLESLLLSVISLVLVLLVVVALVGVGRQLWVPLVVAHDFTDAAGVLLLVGALWAVRQQLRADRRAEEPGPGDGEGDDREGTGGMGGDDARHAGSSSASSKGT